MASVLPGRLYDEFLTLERSLRGEYKMTPKQKARLFIETKNEDSKKMLEGYSDFIKILTSSEDVNYSSDIPEGCVITVVNDDVNAHLMLKVY